MAKTVIELQKVLGHVAKDDGNRKFHSLYDKLIRDDVLLAAWQSVKANGGAGGIDVGVCHGVGGGVCPPQFPECPF